MAIMHDEGEVPARCNQCGMKHSSKERMNKHIKKVHEKKIEKLVKCEECDKYFSSKPSMKEHMNRKHKLGSPQFCSQCDKSFLNKDAMRLHNKNHENVNCKYCPKIYKSNRALKLHIKTIHQDPVDPLNEVLGGEENTVVEEDSVEYLPPPVSHEDIFNFTLY